MAYVADAGVYRRSAARVLEALAGGVLQPTGTAYRLRDAAQAHADLEAGRTTGALYLKP
jgi:NADPH2:quinone reductase